MGLFQKKSKESTVNNYICTKLYFHILRVIAVPQSNILDPLVRIPSSNKKYQQTSGTKRKITMHNAGCLQIMKR